MTCLVLSYPGARLKICTCGHCEINLKLLLEPRVFSGARLVAFEACTLDPREKPRTRTTVESSGVVGARAGFACLFIDRMLLQTANGQIAKSVHEVS